MAFRVKKCVVVFFMLMAFATQAYALVFTPHMTASVQSMPADHHAALNDSICGDTSDLACVMNKVADSSCCDNSAECSPVHCSSLAACVVYSFCSGSKVTSLGLPARIKPVLPLFAVSLYRPPIFH